MPRLDDFLRKMVDMGGSDLHLCATLPPKTRQHGNLTPLPDEPPISAEEMRDILKEAAPPSKWRFFEKNMDLDYAYVIKGLARFRVNYLVNHFGPAAVLRIIPTKILTMEQLKLPPILKNICEYNNGLVLVTGPTGSGKSTTLAAMIDYINTNQSKHIITIEDPIEFVHVNKKSIIVQREVGADTDSFASALKGAMRSDPDIILVGEMRDQETINLALTCAAMGMLVFGTLHTSNAPKTIDRIIDSFPAEQQPQVRAMLAQSLGAVISQILCKLKGGKGRVGAHEILLRTEGLPSMIREGQIASIRSVIEQSTGIGMCSMDGTLLKLLNADKISPLEAYMKAANKQEFEKLVPPEELAALQN